MFVSFLFFLASTAFAASCGDALDETECRAFTSSLCGTCVWQLRSETNVPTTEATTALATTETAAAPTTVVPRVTPFPTPLPQVLISPTPLPQAQIPTPMSRRTGLVMTFPLDSLPNVPRLCTVHNLIASPSERCRSCDGDSSCQFCSNKNNTCVSTTTSCIGPSVGIPLTCDTVERLECESYTDCTDCTAAGCQFCGKGQCHAKFALSSCLGTAIRLPEQCACANQCSPCPLAQVCALKSGTTTCACQRPGDIVPRRRSVQNEPHECVCDGAPPMSAATEPGGLPIIAWVFIGLGALVFVAALAFFVLSYRKKPSENDWDQSSSAGDYALAPPPSSFATDTMSDGKSGYTPAPPPEAIYGGANTSSTYSNAPSSISNNYDQTNEPF